MAQPVQNLDLLVPSHIPIYISNYQSSAEKAQTHTYSCLCAVMSICETLLDIALRSEACAEIIGLLSLTREEAHSLGWKEMARLYAPVGYWQDEMAGWIKARSWADCHKFIKEHDDELVRVLFKTSILILNFSSCCSVQQDYADSLVFLALRMNHRTHLLSVLNLLIGQQALVLLDLPEATTRVVARNPKRPPPHPRRHLLHPLPHPPPTTPPQAVRRRGVVRHLQHRLHVHQAHEVRQGRADRVRRGER